MVKPCSWDTLLKPVLHTLLVVPFGPELLKNPGLAHPALGNGMVLCMLSMEAQGPLQRTVQVDKMQRCAVKRSERRVAKRVAPRPDVMLWHHPLYVASHIKHLDIGVEDLDDVSILLPNRINICMGSGKDTRAPLVCAH